MNKRQFIQYVCAVEKFVRLIRAELVLSSGSDKAY